MDAGSAIQLHHDMEDGTARLVGSLDDTMNGHDYDFESTYYPRMRTVL